MESKLFVNNIIEMNEYSSRYIEAYYVEVLISTLYRKEKIKTDRCFVSLCLFYGTINAKLLCL